MIHTHQPFTVIQNELVDEFAYGSGIRPDDILDIVSSITLTTKEALSLELSVNMGDSSQTLLRKLVVFVSEML